jgi:hypothetical protein
MAAAAKQITSSFSGGTLTLAPWYFINHRLLRRLLAGITVSKNR